MFSLVLELVQRLSILTLHLSCPTPCRSFLSSITLKERRERNWWRQTGCRSNAGVAKRILVCLSCPLCGEWEPSHSLCCSSGCDTPRGWAGISDVSQQKPWAPLLLGRVRLLWAEAVGELPPASCKEKEGVRWLVLLNPGLKTVLQWKLQRSGSEKLKEKDGNSKAQNNYSAILPFPHASAHSPKGRGTVDTSEGICKHTHTCSPPPHLFLLPHFYL